MTNPPDRYLTRSLQVWGELWILVVTLWWSNELLQATQLTHLDQFDVQNEFTQVSSSIHIIKSGYKTSTAVSRQSVYSPFVLYTSPLRHQYYCIRIYRGYSHIVMRSPNDSAIPCVLLRIRTWPVMVPASVFSMLRLANASSPEKRTSTVRNHQTKSSYNTDQTSCEHTCSLTRNRNRLTWPPPVLNMTCWWTSWHAWDILEGHWNTSLWVWGASRELRWTYLTVVETFTLFSHSNSVHMLRNYIGLDQFLWFKKKNAVTHLSLIAIRRFDIVHNIDVDIVQYHTCFWHRSAFP